MARFALIDAGRVTNIIEADADFAVTIGAIDATGAGIGDLWDGTAYSKPPGPSAADLKPSALVQIDADVDAINLAVIGSRAQEYELAEKHGLEYKDAGYTGTVPSSVQSWATAKAWTATQAADDILATAAQWRTAQAAIRAQRLLRKEQVRAATDAAGVAAVMAAWAGFVVAIRGQLGA